MKGYLVPQGYKGYIPSKNEHILFASEDDYIEYYLAHKENDN